MTPRNVILLGVAAVLLLAAAFWSASDRRPAQEAGVQTPLVPQLAERLNEVSRVRISGPGAVAVVTLERGEEAWHVAERNGYPADTAKLRELLLRLAEARRVEAKTANPELYPRLGVEPVDAADAGGTLVEIDGDGITARVIVGQNVAGGTGTYVRHADEVQSWQVDRNIAVDRVTGHWLQRELVDIDANRIARIEVRPPEGEPVLIVRAEDAAGDFRVDNVPRGREQASAFVADSTAGVLSTLRIEDVVVGAEATVPEAVRQSLFVLQDGVTIGIRSWQVDGRTLARIDAGFDAVAAEASIRARQAADRAAWEAREAAVDAAGGEDAPDAVEPDAIDDAIDDAELAALAPLSVSDADADLAQRIELAREEAARLQARFGEHVYVLPNFKAANLNRGLEAYLKPAS